MTDQLERTCRPHPARSCGRRVPFRPLEDWLNARYRNPSPNADAQTGGGLTVTTIGDIVGVTRQTLYGWRNNGIPWWSADAAAIHAGAHPVELWPDFHTTTGEGGVSDATLFRFISSYRDEIDFRHTVSGRRFRVCVHDSGRRPNPTDGLPVEADVAGEWHRYRVAARNEDVAWFRCRPGIDHVAVVELLAATYPDLEPLTDADIYDSDEMQPSGDADVQERDRS